MFSGGAKWVVIAGLVGALLVPASGAEARGSRQVIAAELRASRAEFPLGSAKISGTAPGPSKRTIVAQTLINHHWLDTGKTKTSAAHRFSLPVFIANAGIQKFRVRAPSARGSRSATSRVFRLKVAKSKQFKFNAVYAMPADEVSPRVSIQAIRDTIEAANRWWATQTIRHVQPRWNRDSSGAVKVTVMRLPGTAQAYGSGLDVFPQLTDSIRAATHPSLTILDVAWVNVFGSDACGRAGYGVAIIYIALDACSGIAPRVKDEWGGESTFVPAHEMGHLFGAVPGCAPHVGQGPHVIDADHDLMYADPTGSGSHSWPIILDPGHDDYYGTKNPACPGIETSLFWTTTANPKS